MKLAYRLALLCGLLPLSVGSLIFSLWLVLRSNTLMFAGIFTIYAGVLLSIVGLLALAVYLWRALRQADLPRRQIIRASLLGFGLILANYVLAAAFVLLADTLMSRYTLHLHNASGQPISAVRLIGQSCSHDFGSLPPDARVTHRCRLQHEGSLSLHWEAAGGAHEALVEGYVIPSQGKQRALRITPAGLEPDITTP